MRLFWLAILALGNSHFASAATLGALSGSAKLGSPLEVRVPVQWGPDESPDNLCLRPEASFGETPLGAGALSYQLVPGEGRSGTVLIRSRAVVNEPFVAVSVQVGCAAPFQRRYVLLVDFPTEAAATTSSPASATATAQTAVSAPLVLPTLGRPVPLTSGPARGAGLALDTELGAADRPKRQRAVVRKAPEQARGARLTLLPADLREQPDLDPSLRLSFGLTTEPTGNEEQRKAAAAAWRILGASVDEQLAMALQFDTLQSQSTQWQKTQSEQSAALAELNARNAELEVQRYNNPLVWALAALALLGIALAGLMWRRQASGTREEASPPAWWTPPAADPGGTDPEMGAGSDLPTTKVPLTRVKGADGKPLAVSRVTMPSSRSAAAEPQAASADAAAVSPARDVGNDAAALPALDRRDFMPSLMGVSRSVATEELLDVQQQADFFVSLGDQEQAIRILRAHIAESGEPSPVFYLDLFKIFHKLGRREDYAVLRSEFNDVFNAVAPPFEAFTVQGRGLDAFPAALDAITSHWPEPPVLDVIEQYLFRSPGQTEVFDLDAYRELLMLYGVAKEIINGQSLGDVRAQPVQENPLPDVPSRVAGSAGTGAASTVAMDLDLAPLSGQGAQVGVASSWDDPLPPLSATREPAAPPTAPPSKKTPGKDVDVDLDFL